MEHVLGHYAHATILAREGANRTTEAYRENGRAMRVLGFNLPVLAREGICFDSRLVQDDFDITLQLLRKGWPNRIICWAVQNQSGSGAAGGASDYRDMHKHGASVRLLAEKHVPFVNVVTKKTKVAWGGQERLDVVVQWQRAFASSRIHYGHADVQRVEKNYEPPVEEQAKDSDAEDEHGSAHGAGENPS
jgi:hypothetical protein